jgi:hypothetical protein
VIHDQITIRISPEYFTIAHPPFFPMGNPTLLAFCWGVAATWWVGAAFGFVLALLLQARNTRRASTRQIGVRLTSVFIITGASAVLAGMAGYKLSRASIISLPDAIGGGGLLFNHDRFVAVWFAHMASYAVGISGGILLLLWLWRQQGRPHVLALYPASNGGVLRAGILVACVFALIYCRVTGVWPI